MARGQRMQHRDLLLHRPLRLRLRERRLSLQQLGPRLLLQRRHLAEALREGLLLGLEELRLE
jgi:hypothetical protein